MDKKQEIEILQSLKGDTYFADFFGSHDIDQMCENIKNDFGLEYCCQFYQKTSIFSRCKFVDDKWNDKFELTKDVIAIIKEQVEEQTDDELF